MEYKTMTEKDFDTNFTPILNHLEPNSSFSGCMFETYGEEIEFVKEQPNNTIWTIVTGDDDTMYYISGFHFINRMGYLIMNEPITDDDVEYDVKID